MEIFKEYVKKEDPSENAWIFGDLNEQNQNVYFILSMHLWQMRLPLK